MSNSSFGGSSTLSSRRDTPLEKGLLLSQNSASSKSLARPSDLRNKDARGQKSLFHHQSSRFLTPMKNDDASDTASRYSSTFSAKSLMMTPRPQRDMKLSPAHKPNFEKKMRNEIFNKSSVYSGFSSQKRTELADGFTLPAIGKSQIYKAEEDTHDFTNKPMMSRSRPNPLMGSIREYNDSRSDFLETLGKGHTRSQSSIFGIQRSSFQ